MERALTLLDCFDETSESLTLAELARRSGLYKSTILRLATSLERFGHLVRGSDGRFRLGPALWRLGSLYRRAFDLAETIRPELKVLVDETGETASFYVREGDARVCLYRRNSPKAMRHHLSEGARLSLEGGASAKVLLAFGDDPADHDAGVRASGHAISLGARDPEIAAIAVPVFGPGRRLRGALAVSGPLSRFDEALRTRALAALEAAAARLEARTPPPHE
ncbi:IclR family transcriptional regulator [Salinarimonas ramus]|uniref:IclR family transcriptional regulator n=1 Tax=Salinarimonas ramus TaxID=690164 RepID=A0A917V3L4_9HYPH|nr:IclR family transcriptional regulator [Salinarimonas ramus]GGK34983.1 IclR family transcriptional regulator [Salinarimonas ramus]